MVPCDSSGRRSGCGSTARPRRSRGARSPARTCKQMPGKTHLRLAWTLFAMPLCLSGCGGRPDDVHVEGVVTVDGQPLKRGYVIFFPNEEKGNVSQEEPRAEIQPDGKYVMLTGLDE